MDDAMDGRRQVPAAADWIEVRTGDGRLLFELDPKRWLVRIKRKGDRRVELVDLLEYIGTAPDGRPPSASRGIIRMVGNGGG